MIVVCSPFIIFLSAIIFSLGITLGWPNYIVLVVFYVLSIFFLTLNIILSIYKNSRKVGVGLVVSLVICNHFGIFLGFILASGSYDMLWPVDTMDHHLPNAIIVSKWILGEGEIEIFSDNPFAKIYISNILVGIFFAAFGVHPVISGLAMLLIKLFTVYLIYRSALILTKDGFIALVASIIYGLLPTITFYTIQFYKDFFIQFLVSLVVFIFIKSISINNRRLALLIVLPLAILFVERFYLVVIICGALIIYYWATSQNLFFKISITLLCGLVSIAVLDYYFSGQGVNELIESVLSFEATQNESIDIVPTTFIALDIFRIAFTPFFNLYKLDFYNKYDSLLTFGGFIHQLIMLFYFRGLWIFRKNRIVLLNISFFFLMFILAMIMPYDGRARDSFYSLVSIFAAIGISSFLKRKNLNFNSYRHE
jgi:hypothetical protein